MRSDTDNWVSAMLGPHLWLFLLFSLCTSNFVQTLQTTFSSDQINEGSLQILYVQDK